MKSIRKKIPKLDFYAVVLLLILFINLSAMVFMFVQTNRLNREVAEVSYLVDVTQKDVVDLKISLYELDELGTIERDLWFIKETASNIQNVVNDNNEILWDLW